MLLQFANGDEFAAGAVRYRFSTPTLSDRTNNRIIIPIQVEIQRPIQTEAFLDTGSTYTVISPSVAKLAGFTPEQIIEESNLYIRGINMSGSLTRLNIYLLAQEGQDLIVDSTVFIPDDNFIEIWNNLFNFSVLGLGGFLERFRFAIDFGYDRDMFYFGSL